PCAKQAVETIRRDFSAILWRFTKKKFAPALVLVAAAGRYHRSEVSCLRWNREKTSSLPAFRSKERLVDGSSDRPLRLVNSPPASTLYFLTYTYRRNQASDPWKDA